jgi:predicted O-methyltransferase YrrM
VSRSNGPTASVEPDALSFLENHGIVVAPDLAPAAAQIEAQDQARRMAQQGRPATGRARIARRALRQIASARLGRRALSALLEDPVTRSWILHRLSNRNAANASYPTAAASSTPSSGGFEDFLWLFTPNPLEHGLSRLEIDEAAHLFRLIRSLDGPAVAEVGRFRGGTTLLLAGAGAGRVVSVDNDLLGQRRHAPALAGILVRLGLRDRVEIVVADSRTHPVDAASFDVVFVDADHSYDGVRADFAHWWHALAEGGHLVFHDANFAPGDSRLKVAEGVVKFVAELDRERALRRLEAPGTLVHYSKSSEPLSDELRSALARPRPA